MNERIKELAIQAGMYVDLNGEPWPKWMGTEECELAYAKFAELIVRECIARAVKEEERYDSLGGRDAEYCSAAMANFQGVLAEHFGVKE